MDTLFIGTYTNENSRGIYSLPITPAANGTATLCAEIENPSYLAVSKNKKRLYAVSESNPGKISVYGIHDKGCQLLQCVETQSAGLVHLTLDSKERFLFAASYEDASVHMFRLLADGMIGEKTCTMKHIGHSANPVRQDKAYAHSVCLTPTQRELCVCDLGMDRLVIYHIDYARGTLTRDDDRSISFPAGSGPRHMTFNPKGSHAYVVTELNSQVHAFKWSPQNGFELIQIVELLKEPNPGTTAAAIRISKDGRYAYASNRGEEIIVVYAVQKDETLKEVQTVAVEGKHPRDFVLSPSGKNIYCANRDTNSITCFSRNKKTGMLSAEKTIITIPSPVSVIVR